MKALVLDDDKKICDFIKSLLELYFSNFFNHIDIASSSLDALNLIKETRYDLFLFDVNLGKETSFEILDTFENNSAKIIFITGHETYAIEAIKINAIDYILKPIKISEFKEAIKKALQLIKNEKKDLNVNTFTEKQEKALMLKSLDSIRLVKLNEIIYLEASGPYTDVYMEEDQKITVTKHLKDFEQKLNDTGFYRVHNSFIINALKMSSIHKKDGLTVEMNNKKSVVISSRRKDSFLNFVESYLEI